MTVADVTEQLMTEFEDRLDLHVISRHVLDSCRDLAAEDPQALRPEMVEALARQRLRRASIPPRWSRTTAFLLVG